MRLHIDPDAVLCLPSMKICLALLATLRAVCFAADGDDQTIPAARTDELTPANGWPALDQEPLTRRSDVQPFLHAQSNHPRKKDPGIFRRDGGGALGGRAAPARHRAPDDLRS